jgi:hypothetical protein
LEAPVTGLEVPMLVVLLLLAALYTLLGLHWGRE